jgi:hypothetical protein
MVWAPEIEPGLNEDIEDTVLEEEDELHAPVALFRARR